MKNISVLIFDWSGVISDDRLPVFEANMRHLKKYGKPPMTLEEWFSKIQPSPREFLAGEGVTENPEKLFKEYSNIYDEVIAEGVRPVVYDDAKEVLKQLIGSGKRLIVVSSHPIKNLIKEAKEYGLEEYFDFFIGSSKDKVESILEACKRINVAPNSLNIGYLGDTIFDARAAKKAGVYAISITTGYQDREKLLSECPDIIIDSLKELL